MEDCSPCFPFTKHFFLISSCHVIIKPNKHSSPPGLTAGVNLHICMLFRGLHRHATHTAYTSHKAIFWCAGTQIQPSDVHSWPQLPTDMYSHFARHLFSPRSSLLSHSSFRWASVSDLPQSWRADCNLLYPCGWGVCVQVVNMPPLFLLSLCRNLLLPLVCSFPPLPAWPVMRLSLIRSPRCSWKDLTWATGP